MLVLISAMMMVTTLITIMVSLPLPWKTITVGSDEKTKRAVWSVSDGNSGDYGLTWWWWWWQRQWW